MSKSYLVLMRHGQSQWNLENRFTGFHNIELSEQGIAEAKVSGQNLAKAGIKFDQVYTSTLQRAYTTAEIALTEAGQAGLIATMRISFPSCVCWRIVRARRRPFCCWAAPRRCCCGNRANRWRAGWR